MLIEAPLAAPHLRTAPCASIKLLLQLQLKLPMLLLLLLLLLLLHPVL